MKLIKGKVCKKCGGKNVYLENDLTGWYEHCLICGYTVVLEKVKPAEEHDASWPGNVSIEA